MSSTRKLGGLKLCRFPRRRKDGYINSLTTITSCEGSFARYAVFAASWEVCFCKRECADSSFSLEQAAASRAFSSTLRMLSDVQSRRSSIYPFAFWSLAQYLHCLFLTVKLESCFSSWHLSCLHLSSLQYYQTMRRKAVSQLWQGKSPPYSSKPAS